ncbi:MAG: hypothetical protein EXS05_22260 [Planctomycetaceae bacterium]|nr:hypothetical protein [Planctomycetaceae bacterium]
MNEQRNPIVGHFWQIVATLTVALAIYFGAYSLLLERKVYRPIGVDAATGQNLFVIEPHYRANAGWVDAALRPAQWIDSHLRGEYWTSVEHSSGRKWKNPVAP